MTIQVLEKTPGCSPTIFANGDWYDLSLAETVQLTAPKANKLHKRKPTPDNDTTRTRDVDFDSALLDLGVCIQVPKGYECIIVPRSSTFKRYGLIQTNSIGIIDQSYCSDEDVWKMPVVATRTVTIPKGTRVAQFRVQLSQKATRWQKIKWLLSSNPKMQVVATLNNPKRGGFGSTGK